MECSQARSLVPSYLDGELSEAQAAPLRRHLLDCQPCRAGAQGEKTLKRWFVEDEPAVVPRDFAARVARRAFAGDTGDRFGEAAALAGARSDEERSLRFVLQITSIAALVLIVLSIAVRGLSLPASNKLIAADAAPSLEQALEEADRLNREEGRSATPPTGAHERREEGRAEGRKP